jgi:hypothetical protein
VSTLDAHRTEVIDALQEMPAGLDVAVSRSGNDYAAWQLLGAFSFFFKKKNQLLFLLLHCALTLEAASLFRFVGLALLTKKLQLRIFLEPQCCSCAAVGTP